MQQELPNPAQMRDFILRKSFTLQASFSISYSDATFPPSQPSIAPFEPAATGESDYGA